MKISTYSKIVKYSAIYDVVMTFPFAFPFLAVMSITFYSDIHTQYGFSGTIPEFMPLHLFFVNLFGCVVLIRSVVRIIKPEPFLGLLDSFARFLFSFTMHFYLISHNVTGLLWIVFVPELLWGIIQLAGYYYVNKNNQTLRY